MAPSTQQLPVIEYPYDLTLEWLHGALSDTSITGFKTNRIGTGQVGEVYRVKLTRKDDQATDTDSPPLQSVILKIASQDPHSRASGLSFGIYERETRFYSELAKSVFPNLESLPKCYHSAFDKDAGSFTLVLEDAGQSATVGNDSIGATLGQLQVAIYELGRLHAPFLVNPNLLAGEARWLVRDNPVSGPMIRQLFGMFFQRFEERVAPEHFEICRKFVASFDEYAELAKAASTIGMIHGDYRLDNMLFLDRENSLKGEPGLFVVDWQTVTAGPVASDVAYFLGYTMTPEERREWQEVLLQTYCDALGEVSGNPVMPLDKFKEELKWHAFAGVTMVIISSVMVVQTDRGDDMFATSLARHCQLIQDLGSMDLLPESSGPEEPLKPKPEDETRHEVGKELLWNESWYFDFVDEAQGIAGWVRLGLTPNRSRGNWYIAALTRHNQPLIVTANYDAPAVDDSMALTTAAINASHRVVEPLRKYQITFKGQGETYSDPSLSLQGESGDPISWSFDLYFDTVGEPYQYRVATRYEIPCTATGTINIGNESTIHLADVPAQRDHSWGVRDWWAMDWIWAAYHTHGGRHVHTTDLRIPGAPAMSIGYVQRAGTVLEVENIQSDESFDVNGLAQDMSVNLKAQGLPNIPIVFSPKGHAPVRLLSDDGRVSLFERAWGTVKFPDGDQGVGWVEWNRNQAA